MIEIKKYDSADKQDWNEFIRTAKNGTFLFDRDYMNYHSDRFNDNSLIFYKKNKIIAVLPCNRKGDEVHTHGGLTFGGLIMHYDIKATEVLNIFSQTIDYLKNEGASALIYKVIPAIFHKYPAQEDLYALFRHNAVLFRRDISSAVDLKSPIRFSETKRQSVTKCRNKGFIVAPNDDFSEYWQLLTEVLSKFGTPPVHSLEEIKHLKSQFPEKIKLYECRDQGTLMAGIIIYDYGRSIHTQYMANSNAGRNAGALDYINYILITEVYRDREYYNFGISTESMGQFLNEGLIQQKEMMGGRGIVYDFYKITF
ncbi:GNAT family N-acetyltransferase [Taibaiella soli]|uniref:GNAT family N-acetyltransferase n=1 Tax=Taibaiella soli TaxID=1649169 RepID=A0A2W2A9T4_9BACT|nr:GNAT family N-acetyltransferase [Taibaiella soli]PZF72041.1 GNAT family N-acetyltransferase [Taibaiella soli]